MVRLFMDVAMLLGMSKVGPSTTVRVQSWVPNLCHEFCFFKSGYEVVWEKFGRRAESLATSDPAGSF